LGFFGLSRKEIIMNADKKDVFHVDQDEFDVAKQQAESSGSSYTHVFKKPFEYNGETYTSLTFEWDKLTGRDALAIENEMQAMGKALVVPTFSGEYLIRMAAKACTEPIGADAFEIMSIADYNKIRSAARSFLLRSEL
jgi:hypothetical protein